MFRVSSFEFGVSSSRFGDGNASRGLKDPEPGTRNPKLSREAAFTLLEVVVALAILGLVFALAMELLANGVRSAKASEEYTQAALLARQKMAEVAVTSALEGSADAGDFGGGFRWTSEVQPLPQEEEEGLPARLYQVHLRVTWHGRRREKSLDLYTLRMALDDSKLRQTRAIPLEALGGK